jgi:hypothetical protein
VELYLSAPIVGRLDTKDKRVGIPVKVKVNIDCGRKPNGVPERRLGLSGDLGRRGKGRQPLRVLRTCVTKQTLVQRFAVRDMREKKLNLLELASGIMAEPRA